MSRPSIATSASHKSSSSSRYESYRRKLICVSFAVRRIGPYWRPSHWTSISTSKEASLHNCMRRDTYRHISVASIINDINYQSYQSYHSTALIIILINKLNCPRRLPKKFSLYKKKSVGVTYHSVGLRTCLRPCHHIVISSSLTSIVTN